MGLGSNLLKSLREGRPALEVDWSVISLSVMGSIFKSFVAELLGARKCETISHLKRNLDVQELYRTSSTIAGKRPRFLIKAVIYDMPCFIQKHNMQSQSTDENSSKNSEMGSAEALLGGRDWTNVLDMGTPTSNSNDNLYTPRAVSTADVMQRLGLQSIPGLEETSGDTHKSIERRKLEERQRLEEVLGSGNSVRAKYMEKINRKRLSAELRRERERFAVDLPPTVLSTSSDKSWRVTPGSPALLRYLEERGIYQALITQGDQSQLCDLQAELQNYKFGQIRNLEISESLDNASEQVSKATKLYTDIISSLCAIWSLPPWQVLLVIGDSAQDEGLYKAIEGSQHFICKVGKLPTSQGKDVENNHSHSCGKVERTSSVQGLLDWFKRLSDGKLHEHGAEDHFRNVSRDRAIHFNVRDMTELKWIIEDLNGISYRSTTFIQGFR